MSLDNLEPLDWQPEEYFKRAAARRDMTPEQLRAQLRSLADESREMATHVPFEHLRDGALSEEELVHLDRCNYCSRFLQSVNPKADEVDRFVGEALARYVPVMGRVAAAQAVAPAARAALWRMPAALAAGVALGAIGLSFDRPMRDGAALTAANAAPWKATVVRCQKASGETSGCVLFADAARYELSGDSKTAQHLVTLGLERTGVSPPVIAQVKNTLQTTPASSQERPQAVAQAKAAASAAKANPATDASQWLTTAQLHVIAGQDSQAYVALGNYLKDTAPRAQAAAFMVGFAQPVYQVTKSESMLDEEASSSRVDPHTTVATADR
jgi:hypothetical protein